NLEITVVELAKQVALLDFVADIHRQFHDATIDLGPDRNLVGRADVTRGADGELNVARFGDGGGGSAVVAIFGGASRRVFPNQIAPGAKSENDRQTDNEFHLLICCCPPKAYRTAFVGWDSHVAAAVALQTLWRGCFV